MKKNFYYSELLIEKFPKGFYFTNITFGSKFYQNEKCNMFNSPKGFYPSFIHYDGMKWWDKDGVNFSIKKRPCRVCR